MSDMKTNRVKEQIIDYARSRGADLIGFASIDRFSKQPSEKHPATIFPAAKTVIGLGFRVLRGMLRGIEEGSTFYQYTTMGIEMLEETYMPSVMLEICGMIEDLGFTAVPQKKLQLLMNDTGQTNPEMDFHKIRRNAKHAQLDFPFAASACGLGEIGLSGAVLTDAFGPFQRFCFIITDAAVAEDPVSQAHLCDQCGACRAACPGAALGEETNYTHTDMPVYSLDTWQCAAYTQGANRSVNPFMPPDALQGMPDRMQILTGQKRLSPEESQMVMDQLVFYPPFRHGYATSICGRACDRACYAHLEEKGVLSRAFDKPFRTSEPWVLDAGQE